MPRHAARLPSLVLILAVLQPVACARVPDAPGDPGPQTAVAAPAAAAPVSSPAAAPESVACSDPRPEVCTADYRPVCASHDTGVRCITTPCPSSEQKTYSNACSACSDPKVSGYHEGACGE